MIVNKFHSYKSFFTHLELDGYRNYDITSAKKTYVALGIHQPFGPNTRMYYMYAIIDKKKKYVEVFRGPSGFIESEVVRAGESFLSSFLKQEFDGGNHLFDVLDLNKTEIRCKKI